MFFYRRIKLWKNLSGTVFITKIIKHKWYEKVFINCRYVASVGCLNELLQRWSACRYEEARGKCWFTSALNLYEPAYPKWCMKMHLYTTINLIKPMKLGFFIHSIVILLQKIKNMFPEVGEISRLS